MSAVDYRRPVDPLIAATSVCLVSCRPELLFDHLFHRISITSSALVGKPQRGSRFITDFLRLQWRARSKTLLCTWFSHCTFVRYLAPEKKKKKLPVSAFVTISRWYPRRQVFPLWTVAIWSVGRIVTHPCPLRSAWRNGTGTYLCVDVHPEVAGHKQCTSCQPSQDASKSPSKWLNWGHSTVHRFTFNQR